MIEGLRFASKSIYLNLIKSNRVVPHGRILEEETCQVYEYV